MAQDITIQGNQYQDVPWIDLPKTGGGYARFIDMSEMADYVVKQGTTGIWQYRVWNSGKAECWGKTASMNSGTFTSWGGVTYAGPLGNASYPTNMFSEIYDASAEWIPNGSDAWSGEAKQTGSLTAPPKVYAYRGSGTSSVSGYIRYYARGVVGSGFTG